MCRGPSSRTCREMPVRQKGHCDAPLPEEEVTTHRRGCDEPRSLRRALPRVRQAGPSASRATRTRLLLIMILSAFASLSPVGASSARADTPWALMQAPPANTGRIPAWVVGSWTLRGNSTGPWRDCPEPQVRGDLPHHRGGVLREGGPAGVLGHRLVASLQRPAEPGLPGRAAAICAGEYQGRRGW